MAKGAAAGAILCVLDEKLELIPHYIICIRRRNPVRLRRQSSGRYRIGFLWRNLCWAHRYLLNLSKHQTSRMRQEVRLHH